VHVPRLGESQSATRPPAGVVSTGGPAIREPGPWPEPEVSANAATRVMLLSVELVENGGVEVMRAGEESHDVEVVAASK
jgi:hypothetical protein